MRGLCGLVVARPVSEFDYGCEVGVGLGIQAGVSVSFPAIKIE